jgi:fatty acid desaturase
MSMPEQVRTPITQAIAEGVLSRSELKMLMRRSDGPALIRLAIWFVVLIGTTKIISLTWNSYWIWPAMALHGVVLVHHFSLQHECVHYTAFKTRWFNDLFGNLCGLVIMLPHRFFRYEHCDHHTYTQLTGQDPELIPMPKNFKEYFLYLSSLPYWKAKFSEIFRHCIGRLTEVEKRFLPREEYNTVFWEARLMVAFYLVLLALSIALNSSLLLWYWVLPVVLAEPVMRFIRVTEHVGRPTIDDYKENTRSNRVSVLMQFLCWNMNYHAEHHYASSVPFHALPKLHEKLKDYITFEKRGYIGAHMDIIRTLLYGKPSEDIHPKSSSRDRMS